MERAAVDWLREERLPKMDAGAWQCAFCGKGLEVEAPGSLWLDVSSTRDEARQRLHRPRVVPRGEAS